LITSLARYFCTLSNKIYVGSSNVAIIPIAPETPPNIIVTPIFASSCFFITSELRPVIVEPWDIKDEEDGLPEKSLVRNPAYIKERDAKPRFAEINTIEHTIGLKWKELELQEKQLLEEVKRRMQYATEQVQIEIDQMYLEHQSQVLREELIRRQEDLRRIDELRSQEIDRRRNVIPMHHPDAYDNPFHQNQIPPNALQYNNFQHPSHASTIDAAYTTNQIAHGYDYIQQQHLLLPN